MKIPANTPAPKSKAGVIDAGGTAEQQPISEVASPVAPVLATALPSTGADGMEDARPATTQTGGDQRAEAGFGRRDASRSPVLRLHTSLPGLRPAELRDLADQAHTAMRERGIFGLGLGTDTEALLGALGKLGADDAAAFCAVYTQQYGDHPRKHLKHERLLADRPRARAMAYLDGNPALGDAIGLQVAFDAGDASAAFKLLEGQSRGQLDELKDAYRAHHGRDLEYDMRGFAKDLRGPLDAQGFSLTLRGLKGADLERGFELLHGPRVADHAAAMAEILEASPRGTPEGRREIYRLLSTAGGEERALLAKAFKEQTGGDLIAALEPVFAASAEEAARTPIDTPADRTVAVVVSSGNWGQMLSGQADDPIGGYHWREIEAYVEEALDRGYTPVIFTPDGMPPSPDALSLLQGRLGPKLGFGLRPGTGPESRQGQAIMDGFLMPRPLAALKAEDFATLHIAGGHGSHHDLVGAPVVERAATALHEQGKIVTAVCHASPALGKLLEGGPATGFSPQIDAVMLGAGYVLPEFNPPYDAHAGLKDLGAKLTLFDRAQSLMNIHHTERYDRPGEAPVVTGTGPEATDNVARQAFDWLETRG